MKKSSQPTPAFCARAMNLKMTVMVEAPVRTHRMAVNWGPLSAILSS